MQGELFKVTARHDAGGKVRLSLGAGVRGDAMFYGPRDCYRPLLRRWIGDEFPEQYMLSISMNPSEADASVNDPTLGRDWGFARREGFSGLAKCNIADYRARHPSKFKDPSIDPSSPINLETIMKVAAGASLIVVGHGKLSKPLLPHGASVMSALVEAGYELYCLGVNKDGSPKHPLFVDGATPLERYSPKI